MADLLQDSPDATHNERQTSHKRTRASSIARLPIRLVQRMRADAEAAAAVRALTIGTPDAISLAPITLLPHPFPAALFRQAQALSEHFNTLVDAVSRDVDFLTTTLRPTVAHDAFTGRLLSLAAAVDAAGVPQPMQLGIYRSDYMIDQPNDDVVPQLLQVELNTIAASFAALSPRLCNLHASLCRRWAHPADGDATALRTLPHMACLLDSARVDECLPPCSSDEAVCSALAAAHNEYVASVGSGDSAPLMAAVLMIVQPTERNITDQRGIEARLWDDHSVPLIRATLAELDARATLSCDARLVYSLAGNEATSRRVEVSVVYLRAGYRPEDYPAEEEWRGREKAEFSRAIKCPSIFQHLAGAKKVQQALAAPGVLDRFVSPQAAAVLRSCFARLEALDGEGASAAVTAALAAPHDWVLKPQREGGGNNLYGDDLREALERMGEQERAAYILMQRIRPPEVPAILLKYGDMVAGQAACELGVYSVHLGDGRRSLLNEAAGHLLRVKLASVDEGGVVAGFAALSSPCLYP